MLFVRNKKRCGKHNRANACIPQCVPVRSTELTEGGCKCVTVLEAGGILQALLCSSVLFCALLILHYCALHVLHVVQDGLVCGYKITIAWRLFNLIVSGTSLTCFT